MADNKDFEWNYCPQCGAGITKYQIFPLNPTRVNGQAGVCIQYGKEWLVIWKNTREDKAENSTEGK